MEIIEVTEVTPELIEAFAKLTPQLSSSSPAPDAAALNRIVSSPTTHLLMAKIDGALVGSLTLVVFEIPTGIRDWVEDVVVNDSARGKGVGKALSSRCIEHAAELGAKTIDLTSRPSREVANGLYKKLGFEMRETNVYRYKV